VEVPPLEGFLFDVQLLRFPGSPGGDCEIIIRLPIEDSLRDPVASLQGVARRTMVGPIGPAECMGVVLIESRKALLNPTTQVIVVEPSRVDNRK
jgi:hypothetical protein